MLASPASTKVAATLSPPTADLQQIQALVDALGMAWVSFRLYQDPRPLEGFRAAVSNLGNAPGFPWLVEVRQEGFVWSGRPVPSRRSAVGRLARAAFGRGIGALGFTAPPGPDDVLALLEVIGQPALGGHGPLEALSHSGATGVLLVEHGTLVEGNGSSAGGGDFLLEHSVYQASPTPDASDQAPAAERVEGFLERYLWEYGHFHEGMDSADLPRHGEMTRACIDSLSSLSREEQTKLLAKLLDHHDEPAFRTLLDQLADDELARLADDLDAQTHPLLWEYLRIACDQGTRSGHLLRHILEGGGTAGRLAERAERLLGEHESGGSGTAAARLAAQRPDGLRHLHSGVGTLRVLLATADDERFGRLVRVWAQKVTAALAGSDLPLAEAWLGAMAAGLLTPGRSELVRAEVDAMVRSSLLDALVAMPDDTGAGGAGLVAAFAHLAPAAVIDQLAVQPERNRRRALVDALASEARVDPAPLLLRLDDPRWYLVRNLVLALGRSRRLEAVPALLPLCSHADHRVRTETLRTLRALAADAATRAALAALADCHPAVRAQATTLLRESSDPSIDETLIGRLAAGTPAEEGTAIVTVLARRGSAPARAHLATLAARRLVLSPTKRAIRAAARRELAGEQP